MDEVQGNHTAITDLVEQLTAAWNAADADAWAAPFLEDSVFINIIGMVIEGREANRAQHAAIWSSLYAGSTLAQSVRRIRLLGPDVALVDLDIVLSGIRELPPGAPRGRVGPDGKPALRTIMRHALTKENGRWMIAASQNTVAAAG